MELKEAVMSMVERLTDESFLMYLYAIIRKHDGVSTSDVVEEILSCESSRQRGASCRAAS